MSRTPKKFRRRAKREAPKHCRHSGIATTARKLGAGARVVTRGGAFGEVLLEVRSVIPIDPKEINGRA